MATAFVLPRSRRTSPLGLLRFLRQRRHLVPGHGLRSLLQRHLQFRRLEDASIPLHVVATDVLLGEDVLLSTGDAVDAISASAAIPAILSPVKINGRDLVDGGVLHNTPLSHAVALGAVVWVLSTRIERAYDSTRRWLSTNQRAAGLASLLAPHRD